MRSYLAGRRCLWEAEATGKKTVRTGLPAEEWQRKRGN